KPNSFDIFFSLRTFEPPKYLIQHVFWNADSLVLDNQAGNPQGTIDLGSNRDGLPITVFDCVGKKIVRYFFHPSWIPISHDILSKLHRNSTTRSQSISTKTVGRLFSNLRQIHVLEVQ